MSDQGQTPKILFRIGWSTTWKCNNWCMSLNQLLCQLAETSTNLNEPNKQVQEQLTFEDSEMNVSSSYEPLSYRQITSNGMDISHFFERPIKVYDGEWDNSSYFLEISPWYLYFSKDLPRQKLRGFGRMACEAMEIDIRINGSPFRYGALLASYRPLFSSTKRFVYTQDGIDTYFPIPYADFSGGHIYEDGVSDPGSQDSSSANVDPAGGTLSSILARSQRQHVHLDVASSQGGKMVIPFLYPKEAIDLDFSLVSETSDVLFAKYKIRSYFMRTLKALGTMHIESYAALGNLQTATTNGVSIQIYCRPLGVKAWMASGSSGFDNQGLTSMLSRMWSSAPVKEPEGAVASIVTTPSPEGSVTLSVTEFAKRPAVIAIDPWATTYSPGDPIMAIPIHPCHRVMNTYSSTVGISASRFSLTPAAFVAMNYKMWRGTARVTLRVIASAFHKGRLRISWEPDLADYSGQLAAPYSTVKSVDPMTQAFIWDISTSPEVTLDVGFGAAYNHLSVPPLRAVGLPSSFSTLTGSGSASNINMANLVLDDYRDYINGALFVTVDNRLQSPTDSTVRIVASISFPDLELFEAASFTADMDVVAVNTGYNNGKVVEQSLYAAQASNVPTLSTRAHVYDGLIPQGIGTVPDNLDESAHVSHTFQPTSKSMLYGICAKEDFKDLVLRESPYDTHYFEIPLAQEEGSAAIDSNTTKKMTGYFYPPYLIKGVMPSVPGNYGTTSQCRSMFSATGGATYGYTISTKTFTPNMCRTQLCMLVKECFVGYKSTFEWRLLNVGNNGVDVELMGLERSSPLSNTTFASSGQHTRVGSFPTTDLAYVYANTTTVGVDSFPKFTVQKNTVVLPLNPNDGTTVTQPSSALDYPTWYTRSGNSASLFSTNTIPQLRKRLLTLLGSYLAGGAYSLKGEPEVSLRVPYFSKLRYLPGSCLGWYGAESNQESSLAMVFTAVTKYFRSGVVSLALDDNQTAASAVWGITAGFPKKSVVTFVSFVKPGQDFSVYHYVNIPNLYTSVTDAYTVEA